MQHCRAVLGDDDYDSIVMFQSPDQLITAIGTLESQYSGGSTVPRLRNRIVPQLQTLSTFVTIILLAMGPNTISTACTWGAMCLLIQLAAQSEKTLNEIVELLGGIHKSLTLFDIYNESIELNPEFLKTLFDILVDLLSCSASAIKHLRKNNIETPTVVVSWATVRTKSTTILEDIADKAHFLKQIAEAQNLKQLTQTQAELARRLEVLATTQTTLERPQLNLPCHFLPFAHNPNFYGRTTILRDIQDALTVRDDNSRIRSVALWGTGGIGKSQIALEFASRQDSVQLPVILWIPSEKETEIAGAFNKASQRLNLPGVLPSNTPDRNRDLVLEYLQRTDAKWLLIFDNVEETTNLLPILPTTGHGMIEVPTFTTLEGSDFLLKMVAQRATTSVDLDMAKRFSNRLGGLALALEIIGKQIKARKTTVEQFLAFYNRNRQAMNKEPKRGPKNPYYDKDIETVWETSFINLSPEASKFMMLFSFLAPTDIPEGIFTQGKDIPEDYTFLNVELRIDEAKLEFVDLSLIAVNGETRLISMHRLIQEAYFDWMSLEDRREAFEGLKDLLQDSFSRTAGRHLYTRWKICSSLIQHVEALVTRYTELGSVEFIVPSESLTYLITNASWQVNRLYIQLYLQETGSFMASEKLIGAAFLKCIDTDSLVYAWLVDTASTIHDRQGHGHLALDHDSNALRIHKEKSAAGSVELANAYSAVDRYLRNRARSYFVLGNYDAAKNDLKDAEYWQTLIHGEDSHYHGEYEPPTVKKSRRCMLMLLHRSAYILGKIAALENRLDEALTYQQRALDLMSIGKPTHASVGAAKFQQGVVRMLYQQEEKDMEALRLFRDALLIAQQNSAGKETQADSARVKWRMSQVMEHQGTAAEAEAFKHAADATKRELLATNLFAQGSWKDQEYDSLVGLLYR
ncbi:uncharacterized protein LY89DRAFT_771365 [Mollisia scopiformis]|uniref:NB-ARC domain-containing protein n=1 Tax=Mollisia scopiformis TaxID=149040 RepID=A0A194XK20_MOLSC|nr:uncharacterized protein LY89DRAFT_771365 [Mollisia scopiformis]KUJ20454.1 hypothetical protein LY89DRAFT_771365 [Mollisia scopiformis]